MIKNDDSTIRDVSEVSTEQKRRIFDFLQGAVYCWCKNRKEEWFSIRDLMGGDNFHWDETPLFILWKKYKDKGYDYEAAIKEAGKNAGWMLKKTIKDDKRIFETKKEDLVRKYRWIEN